MKKYLVGTCAYNEGRKIQRVIQKYNDYKFYDVVVIDDGSTDGSLDNSSCDNAVHIIKNPRNLGAGYGIKVILEYGREKSYTAVFFVSGNDKDRPEDIEKLIAAMDEGCDFVQGSRYLPGGVHGAMPIYRVLATRLLHPLLFSLITGRRITDSTNGFRAIRLSLLNDKRIDIYQPWLDRYELEPYLFYKAIKLGYKVKEIPVSKIYPPKSEGYTKMKPFSGWWSILRPLIFLGLGIKK